MRQDLTRKVTFCALEGFGADTAVEFLGSLSRIKIVSRLPEEQGRQRFSFRYDEMPLKDALRWLAVNYNADLVTEDERIAFVPRRANLTAEELDRSSSASDWVTPRICRKGWPFACYEYVDADGDEQKANLNRSSA